MVMNRVARHETRKISLRPATPPQQHVFEDHLAVEEPLEIRVHGELVGVTLRTPGEDPALAAGYLFSLGLLRSSRDIGSLRPVENPRHPELRNVINFEPPAGSKVDLAALRRNCSPSATAGLSGKGYIEQIQGRVKPVSSKMRVRLDVIYGLGESLRKARVLFEKTGGLHAAGIFDGQGVLHTLHEDVGRLNAVDKAIGHMLLQDRLPLDHHILMVSGRARGEVLRKAVLAGLPMVCTAMVPTSLAVEVAREFGVTLLGFFRPDDFNIYTHAERIEV